MVNFVLQGKKTITAPEVETPASFSPEITFGSYPDFLKEILAHGYQCCFFNELNRPHKQAVLRHDIDFDTEFALQSAVIESSLGLKATYFFLMRSSIYNILSSKDYENVCLIRDMGHQVSIHFDPTIYGDDYKKGLQREVQLFRDIFNTDVEIISFHRPQPYFLNLDMPIAGIEHTYQSRYFRDVKYFSDSTGVWRYGHPFDSPEFAQQKSLHLLTHPIWWMLNGDSNYDKLSAYYRQRVDLLKTDFSDNCIPFRSINANL